MLKATRQQTKTHNSRLVLKTIYEANEISRADIARATHLTRPTVSTLAAELMDAGLVIETGPTPSTGGKPPTLLAVDADARQILCLDLGGQSFQGARVDLRGRLLDRVILPAGDMTGEAALQLTFDLIDRLIENASRSPMGISVGTPGLIEPRAGIVRQAIHLRWSHLPLRDQLAGRYQLPILVANDSHAAALGEYTFGPPTAGRNLVLVKTGQGIAAGVVLNGALFYGDGAGAGEIGQIVVEEGADGRPITLENQIGTRALLQRARQIAGPELNWPDFIEAVACGEPRLAALVREAAGFLGATIAQLIAVLNIQQVVISGRLTQFGESFREAIFQAALRRALAAQVEETTIRFSTLGQDLVILGCASMMIRQELGIL